MTDKIDILADISIAVTATAMLIFGATGEGFISSAALVWGGCFAGYLIATYTGAENA